MEHKDELEGLDEAELQERIDSAETYEERSKLRAAKRRVRQRLASQSSGAATATGTTSADVVGSGIAAGEAAVRRYSQSSLDGVEPERGTYKRPGYQVQRNPPAQYGVRHWENVDKVPGLRRQSQSQINDCTSTTTATTSSSTTRAVGLGSDDTDKTSQDGGESSASSSSSRAVRVETAPSVVGGATADTSSAAEVQDAEASVIANEDDSPASAMNSHCDPAEAERRDSTPECDGGRESGYRSESRMSTTSGVSLDSVQSDMELEESLQKQIESSQDYDQRKRLRARLRQVQQRRMSKCQMATTTDDTGRRPSQDTMTPDDEGLGTSKDLTSPISTKATMEDSQPSWVKLARKMSNPGSRPERKRSIKEEKVTATTTTTGVSGGGGGAEVYKAIPLRKTGRRDSSASDTDPPASTLPRGESPYKSIQLRKTGVLEGSASAATVSRRDSSSSADMPTSPYKSLKLKKTGVLDGSPSPSASASNTLTRRESTSNADTRPESPYKSLQLKKTGVLDGSSSQSASNTLTRRESTSNADTRPESPYKSLQLKKTGVLDGSSSQSAPNTLTRRESTSNADTRPESPYKSVQLKKTGVLDGSSSQSAPNTLTRRESTSKADTRPESPYKSVQLKKTGVLEGAAAGGGTSLGRRNSVGQRDEAGSPYKSVSLRKTGRIEAESPVKRRSSFSSQDQLADESSSSSDWKATASAAAESETRGRAESTSSSGYEPKPRTSSITSQDSNKEPAFGTVSLRKTGVLETARAKRGSITDDARPNLAELSTPDKANPWKVALKKSGDQGQSATLPRRGSAARTASGAVDYLSVLRKRKQSSETDGGSSSSQQQYTPAGGSQPPRGRTPATTESPGAEYLAVLRRRKASGSTENGGPEAGGSPCKTLPERSNPSRTERPDYRSALRRSVRKSDGSVLDELGRPRSASPPTVDYLSVLHGKPQQQQQQQQVVTAGSSAVPTMETRTTTHGTDSVPHSTSNGHAMPSSPTAQDIHLPGGVVITDAEESDL